MQMYVTAYIFLPRPNTYIILKTEFLLSGDFLSKNYYFKISDEVVFTLRRVFILIEDFINF